MHFLILFWVIFFFRISFFGWSRWRKTCQGLGVTHCFDFVWVTVWGLIFSCCGAPFRCCTVAAEAGNALETANQSPKDATTQQQSKGRQSKKKRIRKTLRTYTRANPRQSTQLSSVTGCHFSQKALLQCCSLEIPPFAPAERQSCNILWPTRPGQVRAGVTGPLAHQGSASALWLKPGPFFTSMHKGHLKEFEWLYGQGMFPHSLLHDKQDLITAKSMFYPKLTLQLSYILLKRKSKACYFAL